MPLLNEHKRDAITDPRTTNRFRRKYRRGEPAACWLWHGVHHAIGYGQFRYEDSMQQAHRIAWRIAYGEIPIGMCVLHKCDVRDCVNPAHLELGTQDKNMKDCAARHRSPWGERSGSAKLTANQVLEIRRIHAGGGITHQALADRYGVSRTVITTIVNGRSWKYLEDANG